MKVLVDIPNEIIKALQSDAWEEPQNADKPLETLIEENLSFGWDPYISHLDIKVLRDSRQVAINTHWGESIVIWLGRYPTGKVHITAAKNASGRFLTPDGDGVGLASALNNENLDLILVAIPRKYLSEDP